MCDCCIICICLVFLKLPNVRSLVCCQAYATVNSLDVQVFWGASSISGSFSVATGSDFSDLLLTSSLGFSSFFGFVTFLGFASSLEFLEVVFVLGFTSLLVFLEDFFTLFGSDLDSPKI